MRGFSLPREGNEPPSVQRHMSSPPDISLRGLSQGQRLLLTGFGLGLLRPAPGTWGSLPPVVIAFGMASVLGPHWTIEATLILLAAAASIACIRFGGGAESVGGRKDPSWVVADEVAGQALALLLLPWRAPGAPRAWMWNIALAAIAFLAFRALDIFKPPPAHQVQRLRGGLGILMDDLIAGLYALALAQVLVRFVLPIVTGPM